MKAQTKIAALAAAALLSAGAANAMELNIYGASAQGDFWVAEAVPFMQSLGCATTPASGNASNGKIRMRNASSDTSDKYLSVKYGYAHGTGCNATVSGGILDVRVAGAASLEGAMVAFPAAPNNALLKSITEARCGVANTAAGQRLMAVGAGINNSATVNYYDSGVSALLECHQAHVGTTDLDAVNINQVAYDANGNQFPLADGLDLTTISGDKALVVPFTFVVNNNIVARHCYTGAGPTGGTKVSGLYCTDNGQCGSGKYCSSTPEAIDNLTRLQANMLFSGQAPNWKYLGDAFSVTGDATSNVTACLRIPGSGTHGALDKIIMTAGDTGWGYGIAAGGNASQPTISYIGSSDDMVTCVQAANGAVGYVDADKDVSAGANVLKVNYQGAFPSRENIRNGVYEFYTVGRTYKMAGLPAAQTTVYNALLPFANNPKNIPNTTCWNGTTYVAAQTGACSAPLTLSSTAGGKATWWATIDEMKYVRDTDLNYPPLLGAVTPVLP